MVAATINFLDSRISLEKQVCVLGACSYIAGAVVKSSVCGIICATAVIIAYGCLYNAYVIKPSQKAAAQKIQSLESNLRNTEERLRNTEERLQDTESTLNKTVSTLEKNGDTLSDAVALINKFGEERSKIYSREAEERRKIYSLAAENIEYKQCKIFGLAIAYSIIFAITYAISDHYIWRR